jgi:predicted RNase H-like HicB family nuclease
MHRTFTASITREGDWFIAQCLEIEVVSQGKTEDDALANVAEAIQLSFEPPVATAASTIRSIEVGIADPGLKTLG